MSAPRIPLSHFFGYAERDLPRFSHDRRHFTFVAPYQDGPPTLWIAEAPDAPARPLLTDNLHPIIEYSWAHTNKHLLFLQDSQGDENWRLHMIDIETGTVTQIVSRPHVRVHSYRISPHAPETVMIIMNARDRTLYDVYTYNIGTGNLHITARNDGTVKSWHLDTFLKVRAKVCYNGNGSFYLYVRATPRSKWHHAHTWLPDDTFSSGPLFFSPDGRYLYLADATSTNTNCLESLDTHTGARATLFHDEQFDLYNGASLHDLITNITPYPSRLTGPHGTLTAISYYKEKLSWHFFDAQDSPLHRFLSDPSYQQWIASKDEAGGMIIGRCRGSEAPSYWSYDEASGTCTKLFDTHPALTGALLAEKKPISFTTRDGITLNGYLTMPLNSTNAPLIIKVHGGPWLRDIGNYDATTQFLANRGYACLEINFRGSTGYGKKLTNAGNREWGGKMVDDLADAARWACEQGITEHGRIAVMGRSYGGCAALCASWRYKKLFSCAIAEVPPTNLIHALESAPAYWRPLMSNIFSRIGHPRKDRARLQRFSPAFNTARINRPVLISYGQRDARIRAQDIEVFLNRLRETNKEVTVLAFSAEGHRSRCQHNIMAYHEAVERFLATHLPVTTTTTLQETTHVSHSTPAPSS